jgi:hypothetical protein
MIRAHSLAFAALALTLAAPASVRAQVGVARDDVPSPVTNGIPVPQLNVQGLQAFAGKRLLAFFVSARESTLGMNGQSLFVRDVRTAPVEVTIDAKGEATVPASLVPKGNFKIFNYIVLAVARGSASQYFLKNSDGTFPRDPRATEEALQAASPDETSYAKVGFLSTNTLKQLQAGEAGSVTLRSGTEF